MNTRRDNPDHPFSEPEARFVGVPPAWNVLTGRIIGAAMSVHSALGPCLPERLYEEALLYELARLGLRADRQKEVRLKYRDLTLSPVYLDLVVESLVIVEVKAVERVHEAHFAQLVNYLHAASLPLGLVMNFHGHRLKDGVFRRIHPDAATLAAGWSAAPHTPSSSSASL